MAKQPAAVDTMPEQQHPESQECETSPSTKSQLQQNHGVTFFGFANAAGFASMIS